MITSIDQLDLNRSYTFADYLTWQFEERLELLKGKIAKMSPAPNWRHQRMLADINRIFDRYFEEHPCVVFFAPIDVRLVLSSDFKPQSKRTRLKPYQHEQVQTVVQPDLVVICDLDKLDDHGCFGPPDLVVEVLSPGNAKTEMDDKFTIYEEGGVKEYWLVMPSEKCVLVYTLNSEGIYTTRRPFTEGQKVRSNIFPELSVDVEALFKEIK